jgi:2-phosphoglycerate kinase
VLSTDNVRHLLRNFISREESPVLWSSSYHAGETIEDCESTIYKEKVCPITASFVYLRNKVIEGFERQSEIVHTKLEAILSKYYKRNQSIIVEVCT